MKDKVIKLVGQIIGKLFAKSSANDKITPAINATATLIIAIILLTLIVKIPFG